MLVEFRQFEPTDLCLIPLEFRRDFWRQKTGVLGYRMALFT